MRDDAEAIEAGDFGSWLVQIAAALAGDRNADVPCSTCTACCTSSQFVHIAPDEAETLAHLPQELLFAAPGLPRGHVLMGYDDRGHCPMLIEGACSVYEHRPRTCRTYDCRVFAAAGLEPDKPAIAARVQRWRFRFSSADDAARLAAVHAAAAYVRDRPEVLPDRSALTSDTQLAVLAVEIHDAFLAGEGESGGLTAAEPSVGEVRVAVRRVGRHRTS